MSWLTVNGIELSGIVALESPSGDRRDIGGEREAADGSTSLTRQTRKRDIKLETVPLSGQDAFAWEGLLTGEGHVWSFDLSFYSSKGRGPTVNEGSLENTAPAPITAFGGKYVRLEMDEQLTFVLGYTVWTVAFWVYNPDAEDEWTYVVRRSDGAQWINGVRNDAYTISVTFDFTGGTLSLTGPNPGPANIDDLVVSPYLWPEDWPAQVLVTGLPFAPTPFLRAAGLLVPEAATRQMLCTKIDEKVMKLNLGDGAGRAPDVRTLSFELRER